MVGSQDPPSRPARSLRLGMAMARAGFTQRKLAELAGCSPQQINNILGGRSDPSTSLLTRLAEACGFNLDWYFTGKGWPWRLLGGDHAEVRPNEEGVAVRVHYVRHDLCGDCGSHVSHGDDYCLMCGRRLLWPEEEGHPPEGQEM